jgi:uncharacterized alkaline shock family protein YloU
MSVATAEPRTSPGAEQPRPAAERGRLTISRKAFEKIARGSAAELSAAAVAGGSSWFGLGPSRSTVEVELHSEFAVLSVEVGLPYPAPLRPAAEALRTHIAERVGRLTGIPVRRVDLRVGWLIDEDDQRRVRPR